MKFKWLFMSADFTLTSDHSLYLPHVDVSAYLSDLDKNKKVSNSRHFYC